MQDEDNLANIFLTLDIENDGFSPLLVYYGMREDARDEEEPVRGYRQGQLIKSSRAFDTLS